MTGHTKILLGGIIFLLAGIADTIILNIWLLPRIEGKEPYTFLHHMLSLSVQKEHTAIAESQSALPDTHYTDNFQPRSVLPDTHHTEPVIAKSGTQQNDSQKRMRYRLHKTIAVLFEPGYSSLAQVHKTNLAQQLSSYAALRDLRIRIVKPSIRDNHDTYVKKLNQSREQAIEQFLIDCGVTPSHIDFQTSNDSVTVNSDHSTDQRDIHRRVDVKIYKGEL